MFKKFESFRVSKFLSIALLILAIDTFGQNKFMDQRVLIGSNFISTPSKISLGYSAIVLNSFNLGLQFRISTGLDYNSTSRFYDKVNIEGDGIFNYKLKFKGFGIPLTFDYRLLSRNKISLWGYAGVHYEPKVKLIESGSDYRSPTNSIREFYREKYLTNNYGLLLGLTAEVSAKLPLVIGADYRHGFYEYYFKPKITNSFLRLWVGIKF